MKSFVRHAILLLLVFRFASATATAKNMDELVSYSYEALPNGTVRFIITNNEALPITGDLIRERVRYPQNGEILTEFIVQPSASFSYLDDTVLPGDSYVYIFEYTMPGLGEYIMHFDTITAVATIPALGHFDLIAPYDDEPYDFLREGYQITIKNTNIMVEANALTRSVIFFLNGKVSKDNTAPFTLFPESHCDYGKGHLRNGSYTLTAIAYPLKNGHGKPGDTLTVSFTVLNIYGIATVTVYPNPVRGTLNVKVTGPAESFVSFRMSNGQSENNGLITTARLDSEGQLTTAVDTGGMRSGVYVLSVSIEETVINTKVFIE